MKNEKVYDLKRRTLMFSLDIIAFLKSLDRNYISQTIGKQLLRSATSIGANVIEAYASPSKKDFANFYNIALKSANESKYWLYLLAQSGLADKDSIDKLLKEADELSKILAKSLITMRGR